MTTTAIPAADTGLPNATPTLAGEGPALSGRRMTAAPDDHRIRETEILRLFHEHRSLMEAGSIYCCANIDDRDLDAKMDRIFHQHTGDLEDRIMAMPSTCAADAAAKMILAHREGENSCLWWDAEPWLEARALVGLDEPPSEIMRRFAECVAFVQETNRTDRSLDLTNTEVDAHCATLRLMEAELIAVPCTTMLELAAKVYIWTGYGEDGDFGCPHDSPIHREITALLGVHVGKEAAA